MKNLSEKVLEKKSLRKNLSVTAMMFITLSILLTGCGQRAFGLTHRAPEADVTQLQNEAGDFQYADVSWGMDKASVEAALGITFDQGSISSSSGTSNSEMYIATDAYTLTGLPARVICEFDNSGLYSINFRVSPTDKDVQTCWDILTTALLTQYGSTDPSFLNYDSPVSLESETYRWEHSDTMHTALSAMKTSIDGKTPMIEFRVYVVPSDK